MKTMYLLILASVILSISFGNASPIPNTSLRDANPTPISLLSQRGAREAAMATSALTRRGRGCYEPGLVPMESYKQRNDARKVWWGRLDRTQQDELRIVAKDFVEKRLNQRLQEYREAHDGKDLNDAFKQSLRRSITKIYVNEDVVLLDQIRWIARKRNITLNLPAGLPPMPGSMAS
ncbi:hypothetical protein H0H93_016558, partial [Arthromyces matolae]